MDGVGVRSTCSGRCADRRRDRADGASVEDSLSDERPTEFNAHFFRTKFRELGKRRAKRGISQKTYIDSFARTLQRRTGIAAIGSASTREATVCPPPGDVLFRPAGCGRSQWFEAISQIFSRGLALEGLRAWWFRPRSSFRPLPCHREVRRFPKPAKGSS